MTRSRSFPSRTVAWYTLVEALRSGLPCHELALGFLQVFFLVRGQRLTTLLALVQCLRTLKINRRLRSVGPMKQSGQRERRGHEEEPCVHGR